jgi:ABC-type Na+ transport system ATPase subunit NatA
MIATRLDELNSRLARAIDWVEVCYLNGSITAAEYQQRKDAFRHATAKVYEIGLKPIGKVSINATMTEQELIDFVAHKNQLAETIKKQLEESER